MRRGSRLHCPRTADGGGRRGLAWRATGWGMEDWKDRTEETGRAEALRRIAACAETQADVLDLSGLMLRELPEEVYALTWLRGLDLGLDREATKRLDYWRSGYNQGKGRNALAAVPERLAGLVNLTNLNLFGNTIGAEGAEALAGLVNLTTLNLWDNNIGADGAEALAGLVNLTTLDLRGNDIGDEGARALKGLVKLTDLNLSYNSIGAEGAQALAGLVNLTTLNLMGNNIGAAGAQALAGLVNLTSLDLAHNNIGAEGAQALAGLVDLTDLNLLGNYIGDDGAQVLAGLVNLTTLDLWTNNIGADGAEALAGLVNLTTLDLRGNDIGDEGARALKGLVKLTDLNLSYNSIGAEGAQALAGLVNLTTLNLYGNGEIDAEPLYGLRHLKSLDASWCAFPDGFDLGRMSFRLEKLILHETRIPGVPPEVLSQDFLSDNCLDRLLSHEDDLKAGAAEIGDVKFMILGNGRVGKTQIVRRLSLPPERQNEAFDEGVKSTHGVQVTSAPLAGDGARPITLRIWDFGGQDIYHGTHALFLKSRAIFPVVWNPESETLKEHEHGGFKFRNQPLGYWVEYVRRLGGRDAPLLIVQSQTDRIAPVPVLRMGEHLAADALDGVAFQRMLAYSAATNDGRPGLDAAIAEAADFVRRTQGVGKTGIARAEVKRRLEDMAEAGTQLLPWKDYLSLCEQVQAEGHGTIASPRDLVGFLHNIGTVFWRAGLFDNRLILDQAWVLQHVYAVLDREEATFKMIERAMGRFTVADLARTVWKDNTADERALFLTFMESCGVAFQLREGNAALGIETEYIAPDLLPPRMHPAIDADLAQMWDKALATETAELDYDLLPPGLLRTFMAKIGNGAGLAGKYWREGCYFFDQETGARAMVEERRPKEGWRGDLVIRTQRGSADVLLRRLLQMVAEDRVGLGAKPREVRINGKPVEAREAGNREPERAEIAPTHEPRTGKQRFVSYAWGDDSEDGKERTRLVEELCAEAERRGKPITRDKDSIAFSDSISTFMDRMIKAAADDDSVIYILLTDAYLARPNPMKELWGVWDNCNRHPEIFKSRTRVFVHSSVRIGSPLERAQHANDWIRKYEEMEAGIARLGTGCFADQDVIEHMRSNHFVRQTPAILYYFHDAFSPRDFAEFLKYGFED